jgi:hypothetical protein
MADFKLGRIKFKWRGTWVVNTGYLIDDVAKYGGNSYVCIQNHTSPNNENIFYTTPGTYTDYWSLQQEALFFKGAYANSTWYKLNDLVSYGAKQYRCTTAHTSSSAVINLSNFEQFVDSLVVKGDYANNTQYKLNDIVSYGGKQYQVTTEHTSSSTVLDQSKFALFVDGHEHKGAYASSTQYKLNDIVKYGGRHYRCTTEHSSASGGDVNINLAHWALYTEGLAFRGDYAVDTYYRLDDVVKWGGYQERCTTAHTSGAALSDYAEANWTTFSDGLQWEDSYAAGTLYQKGDVVTYGGYSYVYVNDNEAAGQTPADNAYWDLLAPGFNALGAYSHGTGYKVGDVLQYGGNSYVTIVDNTNEYPANTNGTVNSTYWQLVVEGLNYEGTYNAGTTYQIGDVVNYSSSSYVMLKDRNVGTTPGTDAAVWDLLAQGDSSAVLTTRGDIIIRDDSAIARLAVGSANQVITTDGTDVTWGTITTVGALDSGSITSGFTSIDVGAGAITTTGVITGGTVEATTDTAAGDNAAIGYTAAEGLILTGQGSTNDVTIKNDADADVISIPTGTINVTVAGDLTVSTSITLATGATVTGILDEDAMGSDSATQLATQQSIKAYVDAVEASDITTVGTFFSNWNTISENLTTTLTTAKNRFLCGAITVADTYTWTVAGAGTLTIITSITLATGATVTGILDEDAMGSDSATALATQQSIKAYADTKLANVSEDSTPSLGGDLDVNGNDIVSTSNADIDIIPNGSGDVNLGADTVQVGDNDANATITTQGTGDLTLNTNNGTNAGNITLLDGVNGNINITPNGSGSTVVSGSMNDTISTTGKALVMGF